MIDIAKQIAYWQEGAAEDWAVAEELLQLKHIRHALFFMHLTLEKLLKAPVCKQTSDLAPRMHNLVRLAQLANISIYTGYCPDFVMTLADINAYNLEGRYPDSLLPMPSLADAKADMIKAEEIYLWLKAQL